eukprot:784343_1
MSHFHPYPHNANDNPFEENDDVVDNVQALQHRMTRVEAICTNLQQNARVVNTERHVERTNNALHQNGWPSAVQTIFTNLKQQVRIQFTIHGAYKKAINLCVVLYRINIIASLDLRPSISGGLDVIVVLNREYFGKVGKPKWHPTRLTATDFSCILIKRWVVDHDAYLTTFGV